MVLLKDDNQPPNKWNMGRVVKTYTGKDGHVRVADIKTSNGIFQRPITKICRLPIDETQTLKKHETTKKFR